MTILSSNIRLLESERMTDTSDGGGRRTNRVIPDGVAGNVFPKVSRVDSVYGRVNLRKIYPHINTATLDVYAGAHFIITDAPDNDRISVLAFSTDSDFDLRAGARDRIESYVIAGPESRSTLYGRQLEGSRAILVYQRTEEPLPEVGDVYAISNEVGSVTSAQQFVRVQDVVHEVRTFTDEGGEFQRRVITLKIGARLRYEFTGVTSPSRYSSAAAGAPGRLRTTTVADAARYHGIQPVLGAVDAGSLDLSLLSVFGAIVPTTLRESAVSLASAAGASALIPSSNVMFPAGGLRYPVGYNVTETIIRLPTAVAPGQISFAVEATGGTLGPVTADLEGNFPDLNDPSLGPFNATVDYETGIVRVTHWAQLFVVFPQLVLAYKPAARVSQAAHTKDIPVTLATRGTVYSVPLLPIPAPGTLIVEYRAQGKWYRLRDAGIGELAGDDPAYGTGNVDYVGGGATVTLGALPDVGSSVLFSWGSPTHFQVLAAQPDTGFEIVLAPAPVKPSTVEISWLEGVVPKTATDNGSGLITGDATGTIVYQTGALKLVLPKPIAGTVTIDYDRDTLPTSQPGFNFGGAVAPHTVRVTGVGVTLPDGLPFNGVTLVDNGAGVLQLAAGAAVSGYVGMADYWVPSAQSFGTVNYATGVVTVASTVPVSKLRAWNPATASWDVAASGSAALSTAAATFTATPTATTPSVVAQTNTATIGSTGTGLSLKLAPLTPMELVPGSLMFTAFGKTYIDRNGLLYTDVSYATGSGMVVGSVDYTTGEITLTDYPSATTANFVVIAALGRKGEFTSDQVFFRTAGSPLRPASLYVQCTAADGELLAGTSDQSGNITGGMLGTVEQTMGVVRVNFAKQVLPGTLRYSTVVLSNLPLDADQLGLDPVRLPSDGRVPIFRPADVVVLHHTAAYNAGTPAAGAVINVGRTNLSALWLEDANRKKLADSMYAPDLAAGTVTMAADLSLAGYVPPLSARHRIEEMGLLSDVQINGQVSLSAQLLRAFPSGSYLSSALLYGDLQARATNLFDQQTWTGVWQSTVIGNGATAQFNDIDYPVEVLNNGAVTERWRLSFTTPTSFQIIGENLGVIGVGTTSADVQLVNALTGQPYFTLRAAGFGAGWAAGNQLRFDTISAAPPTWLARTVLPGAALTGDSFDAQLRGDVD